MGKHLVCIMCRENRHPEPPRKGEAFPLESGWQSAGFGQLVCPSCVGGVAKAAKDALR